MSGAAELEGKFAEAVLDQNADVPAPLVRKIGGTPSRRFGVYRNNVYASLIDVLAGRFPMTARLVGDDFFRAMARVYVEKDPPRSPVLLWYGGNLADFIAGFAPAAPVPYLADVARLEWAWHAAYHAAEADPLPLTALQAAAADAGAATLSLHPSLQVVSSSYPVVTIWQLAACGGEDEPARLSAQGEDALVLRPKLEVEARRLPKGGVAFVCALKEGATLQDAAGAAIEDAPAFDLETNLAGLMASGAIVGVGARNS
jgi:hypothetical protein